MFISKIRVRERERDRDFLKSCWELRTRKAVKVMVIISVTVYNG